MYLVESKELFPDIASLWEELRNIDDDDDLREELFEELLKEEILIFPIIQNSNKDIENATNVIASLLRNVVKSGLGSIYELIKYNSFVVVPTSDSSVDKNQIAHAVKSKDIKMPVEIRIPQNLTLDKACFALYDVFKTALNGVSQFDEDEMYEWLTTTIVGRIFAKASTNEPDEGADEDEKLEWALETFKYDVQGVGEEVKSSNSIEYIKNPKQHNVEWTLQQIVENPKKYNYLREPYSNPDYHPERPRIDNVYNPQSIGSKYNIGRHNR